MNARVRITDVAPRDGLQNEPNPVPTAAKIELVNRIAGAGVDEVEVSSFVSPKWIPQLGDAAEVFAGVSAAKPPGCLFSALVPNEQGMLAALEVNARAGFRLIEKVSVFSAASETFSKRNTNATIAETIDRFRPVVQVARIAGIAVRGYISCAIRCPFEGDIAPMQVSRVATELSLIGVDEIDLADTIGAGTPASVAAMLTAVIATLGDVWTERLTLHLHDTFGGAAACIGPALQLGLRSFDGASGGLGGCPYASTSAKRAPGNLATLALVQAVHAAGFATGVAVYRLADAAEFATRLAQSASSS